MTFDLLLALARTFGGPQLTVLARDVDLIGVVAGARLASAAVQRDKPFAVLTFDVLYRIDLELVPGRLLVAVSDKGYDLLV